MINGALNLVRGEQLAWQERKAESFTMSRLHCGCLYLGYRPSAEYGHGITLGTAFAISGAAANPNMGYHSSPVVGFLLALFNVRLGWWLGNPGSPGAKTWRRSGPAYSVGPLFSEAFGITTDRRKYVNVSDGGHFENLGLYEMMLRRCHYIVMSDAGEDPECSFADLGDAVRKIRIDLGISIEFDSISIYPRSEDAAQNQKGRNCAIGRICYSMVDGESVADGVLIYIKPACYGNEQQHHKTHGPIRNFKERKNLTRDLHQQPRDNCVGDRNLVDVAPLQLSEEVFRVHSARLDEALVTPAILP